MKKLLCAVLATGCVLMCDASAEDTKSSACSLLTSAEIGTAFGGKVGKPQGSEAPITTGPSKGETMRMCMWSTAGDGMVSVTVLRVPKGTDRATGLATLTHALDKLKAQGWREEKRELGNAKCMTMTPPSNKPDLPLSTGCLGESGEKGISVGAMGRKRVPMEKVKALLDKAIARLR